MNWNADALEDTKNVKAESAESQCDQPLGFFYAIIPRREDMAGNEAAPRTAAEQQPYPLARSYYKRKRQRRLHLTSVCGWLILFHGVIDFFDIVSVQFLGCGQDFFD